MTDVKMPDAKNAETKTIGPKSAEADAGITTAGAKHWLGFIGSGLLSFVVDGGVLKLLTLGIGWGVLPSRIVSIGMAMIAGWLAHRTFTFAVKTPPTVGEFARFVGAALSASLVNYLVFAAILFLWPRTEPLVALFISGVLAMGVSYMGFRFAAFGRSGH